MKIERFTFKGALNSLPLAFLRHYSQRIRSSPLGYRLARGAFWTLTGTTISRGLALLASILVARVLGREGYGALAIIQSTVGMLEAFAGFGLGLTAAKHVAEFRIHDRDRAGRIIALSRAISWATGGLMAFLLLILAPWLASRTLAAPHLSGMLRVGSLMLLFGAANGALGGALLGLEAFKTIARVNLWAGMAAFPLILGGVYWAGMEGAVWGLVGSIMVNWLLNHLALRAEARSARIPLTFAGFGQERKILWSFSLPALLSTILFSPAQWICNAMLVNQPKGYAEMGMFNASNQWRTVLLFAPSLLMEAALPIMSSSLGPSGSKTDFNFIVKMTHGFLVIVGFPVGTALMFLADRILPLYGSDFSAGVPILITILCTALIMLPGAPLGSTLQAKGKMWLGFAFNLSWGCVLIASVFLMVSRWGALALALGYTIAYLCLNFWGLLYLAPDLPPGMLKRIFAALFYSLLLAGICVALTPPLRLFLSLPFSLLSFLISLFFLVHPDFRARILNRPIQPGGETP